MPSQAWWRPTSALTVELGLGRLVFDLAAGRRRRANAGLCYLGTSSAFGDAVVREVDVTGKRVDDGADVRWMQRLEHFASAVLVLERVSAPVRGREATETEGLALIQAFEVAHELAWNLLKDYLEFEGVAGLVASKSATREAFYRGILPDGQVWMDMIIDRNRTSHTYDATQAAAIAQTILADYVPQLTWLRDHFTTLAAASVP